MNMYLHALLAATFLLTIKVAPAGAEGECSGLTQIASTPLETLPAGLVYTSVVVNHRPLNFLLDTRVQQTLISEAAATAAGLPRERMNRVTRLKFCMDDNTCLQEFATADAMQLGGLTAKVQFGVVPGDLQTGIPGLLGADFLHNWDMEFDFGKNRLNVFSPEHCDGGVVYWTRTGASRIPIDVNSWGEVLLKAELDGHSIYAEVATGLPKSYLVIAQGETKYGTDKDWKLIKREDEHRNSSVTYEHVFKSLSVGDINIENMDLTIYSGTPPYLGARLYLGMDVLRHLHLYIAYKERNLYVSAANAGATPAAQQLPAPPQPPASTPAQQQSATAPGH